MKQPELPSYIQWYPTFRCNQNCGFCFNRYIPCGPDMRMENIQRFASVLADQGIRKLDILGGEPTLLPWFGEMVHLFVRGGFETSISSNGSNPGILEEVILTTKGEAVNIGISLNSLTASDDLDDLIIRNIPIVKGIVNKDMTMPEALKKYFGRESPKCFLLYRDAVEASDLEEIPPFEEFFQMAADMKMKHGNVDCVYCSGFVPDVEQYPVLEHARCPAGTTKLSVMPDGSVYPCYLLFRDDSFRLGNILTDDFRNIWQSPRLDFFRFYKGNLCPKDDCILHRVCHGGCPAVSLIVTGSLESPDPRCMQAP